MEKLHLYLVRHCESLGNHENIFQGQLDLDISATGEKQLALLALRFRNIPIDAVYSSPLKRAYKTAEAVDLYHSLPIIKLPELMEVDVGALSGMKLDKAFADYPVGTKILIADDESDIVSMLGSFFESKGFRVLPAFNGAEALKQVEKQPDIILLDINMPGTDGLEVCKRIRDHISCPILFLTARIEDTDKVKGFTVGGDDYIVKPFSLMELEARVRAHLRREARHNFEAQVKFSGDLTIDYSERCVFFGDKRVGLAKKEFDIVELLSQNPGQIFDKERIYERIWGYDSEGDSSVVAEHIRRIRSKIAAYTDRIYIETVWGCGYKWVK